MAVLHYRYRLHCQFYPYPENNIFTIIEMHYDQINEYIYIIINILIDLCNHITHYVIL